MVAVIVHSCVHNFDLFCRRNRRLPNRVVGWQYQEYLEPIRDCAEMALDQLRREIVGLGRALVMV